MPAHLVCRIPEWVVRSPSEVSLPITGLSKSSIIHARLVGAPKTLVLICSSNAIQITCPCMHACILLRSKRVHCSTSFLPTDGHPVTVVALESDDALHDQTMHEQAS